MPQNKILFILPSLVAGGAERVISYIAQNVDKNKFDPTLLVIGKEKDTSYDTNGLRIVYFEKDRVLQGIIPMFRFIRREKPKLVVTAIGHLNSAAGLIAIFFPKIKFIAREVNVLTVVKQFKKKKNPILGMVTKFSYRFIDVFICQSKDMKNDFLIRNNVPERKVKLINNPITDGFELNRTPKKDNDILNCITVASLKKQKGHIRILDALSKCDIPFKYTIIGNGAELDTIMDLIDSKNLKDKVTHIPFTKNVPDYLAQHDLFLQGSFVEGFPNSLLESCSVGTPVLAFNAPGGLDEIIEEGVNGFIANDEAEFIDYLKKCRDYPWDAHKINQVVTTKFSKRKILDEYEILFSEVIK